MSLLIGQLIIIRNAVLEDWSNSWVFGFITILATDVILLFLPMVRGYLIYGRGDVLTHIGYVKDMLNSGHVYTSNIYPVEHILTITIYGITNIGIGALTIIIPAILFLLFVLWYALFILQVFERKVALLILPISALPLFGTGTIFYAPNMLSFYFMPFLLYVLSNAELEINQTKYKYEYMTILFLAIICMLFFHPITFLYLIAIILLFYATKVASNKFYKEKKSYHHFFSIKSGIIFLLGLIIASYTIYSSNPLLKSKFKQLLSNFFGLNPLLHYYTSILQSYDIRIVDIMKIFVCKFSKLFILAISSTILIIYYLTKYFRKFRKNNSTKERIENLSLPSHRYLIFFVMGFIFFSIWGLANMFIHFLSFTRVFRFIIFFSVPLTGFLFYISNKKYKKAKFIFIGVLILLTCISIIGLFSSHWAGELNSQVSHGEYEGMYWFLEHRDDHLLIYEQGPPQFRFYDAIYGTTDTIHRKNILRSSATRIPDHFGYHSNIGLAGQLYEKDTYFVISTVGKFFYENMYPQYKDYWRFVPPDYKKFENSDVSANKIYTDGELECFEIRGMK